MPRPTIADLHDHPRSKSSRGEQVAKKGDVREFDGEEYESLGAIKDAVRGKTKEGDKDAERIDMDEETFKKPVRAKDYKWTEEPSDEPGRNKIEMWKKRERPSS